LNTSNIAVHPLRNLKCPFSSNRNISNPSHDTLTQLFMEIESLENQDNPNSENISQWNWVDYIDELNKKERRAVTNDGGQRSIA